MTADEDDWKMNVGACQNTLEFKPARPRQSDVENEATRGVGPPAVEEFLGRCECLDLEANRTKQVCDALANRGVVIDYKDGRLILSHASARG